MTRCYLAILHVYFRALLMYNKGHESKPYSEVMLMTKYEGIVALAKNNNGIVTTALVQENGIARQYLKNMVDSGTLEKVTRGVYVLPEVWDDEFVTLQSQFKKGIYSNETALFLHDLTDRTPTSYSMSFPNNYNLTKVKNDGVLASRAKEPFYSLGIIQVRTPTGNIVWAYNMEKTLCDILRATNNVEIGVIAEAFKRYMLRPNKNIPLLSDYAKKLKVEKKIRAYLEVLL